MKAFGDCGDTAIGNTAFNSRIEITHIKAENYMPDIARCVIHMGAGETSWHIDTLTGIPDPRVAPGARVPLRWPQRILDLYPIDSAPLTMILPHVREANNNFYLFMAECASAAKDIQICPAEKPDTVIFTLNANNDSVTLYSDGFAWHQLIAPIIFKL